MSSSPWRPRWATKGTVWGTSSATTRPFRPYEAILESQLGEKTGTILTTLTAREEKIMKMRFGIGEEVEHTLEEIGRAFKVSRERIRQIEKKALKRLKHPTRKAALEDFLE